jgi:hypothetical protein
VEILRGNVDYAGTAAPTQNTSLVASYPKSNFDAGRPITTTIDTKSSCFVRVAVRNSAGAVVALSNPVWLLRSTPPSGIPVARSC